MNKKKFIIAIIIFVFLGLTVFTFASPKDDDKQSEGVFFDNNQNEQETDSSVVASDIEEKNPVVYLNDKSFTKTNNKVKYFKKNVKTKVEDGNLKSVTLTKNGKSAKYQDNQTITKNGKYVLTAKDEDGNKTKITFVIDKTAPTIKINDDSVGNEIYSKISFTLKDNRAVAYYKVNGKKIDNKNAKKVSVSYNKIKSYLTNGENTIVVYDTSGNKASKTFMMDLVFPKIIVKYTSIKIESDYSRLDLNIEDDNLFFVSINGKSYDITSDFSDEVINYSEGENIIIASDIAGNKTIKKINVSREIAVSSFEDLKNAFASGGKIRLLRDIEIEEQLVLKNNTSLKLNMNGKKMTIKNGCEVDPMIDVRRGSSLDITGNGTFDLEDNAGYSFIAPRGDVTIYNGTFLIDTGLSHYGSYFIGINGGTGKLIIYDGYFDGGYYQEGDEFNNSWNLLNASWRQYIRVYGGTFVGQNPAYGDEGMAFTNPNRLGSSSETDYCQGLFFEGQTREDTQIPSNYTVTKSTHKDGRPIYTVNYQK